MIVKINGTDVTAKVKKDSTNISNDKSRSLSIVFVYKSTETFPKTGYDIQVFEDADTYFGGVIKSISFAPEEITMGAESLSTLSIYSDGYNSIPQRRTIQPDYSGTAGSIVTILITDFLSEE